MARAFSRQLTGKHRTQAGDERLGSMLAFVAGAINAGGFLAVGVYTSHMSGWVSGIADHIVLSHYALALWAMGYITCFLAGATLSSLLVNWARHKQLHSEFALTIMIEAALLLLFGVLASLGSLTLHATIALLCFIMGLQNSLITKISHAEIRTTHVTGIVTDLGIELGRLIFERTAHSDARFHPHKVALLLRLLASFFIGGLLGALLFKFIGFSGVIPFSLLLAGIALAPVADDLWPGRPAA
ncbi:MAG TPA: YoaK family protein [Asticcacaulis sp.]|nr:YoaK family protein [Asticcacaulis sp.]